MGEPPRHDPVATQDVGSDKQQTWFASSHRSAPHLIMPGGVKLEDGESAELELPPHPVIKAARARIGDRINALSFERSIQAD